jgi:uncharacterized protein YchJ
MAAPTRNGPCPCGSGVKYKKCCLPKEAPAPAPPISGRLGQAMRRRREGPAAQLARFAEPLVAAAGGAPDHVERAMTLAMMFWNLALLRGERQEQAIADMAARITKDPEHEREVREMAAEMIERHRAMFPELHPTAPAADAR